MRSVQRCALTILVLASPLLAQSLTHRSDTVSFTVTSDGLSSIRIGERELAVGGWALFNAEGWFKDGGDKAVKVPAPTEKSIEVVDPRRARVRHAAGDVVVLYDYQFDGQDVLISARVENNHASSPLNVAGFSGLKFSFAEPPAGQMNVQHISYFQAHGLHLCHPSNYSRIGGSYAADSVVGVGVSPWNTGISRTLILWDYADWNPDKREKSPQRKLIYFANTPVPARGAATIDLKLRVSANRDWKHLLEPYREHFRKTFGEVRYKADHRWIASEYLNHSQKAIGPNNPYGFHGQHRRIDTPQGVKLFCEEVLPRIQKFNGQGVVLWGQGGDDPRGGMYRPDFDVLPPEVEQNWPALAEGFKRAGLRLGVTTRPRHMAVKQDWKEDQIIDINPRDEGHRAMLWRRFDTMAKRGCGMYYLDSFGDSLEDVLLMRFLREKMGPDVLTFVEHQCDAMMVYSGGYSEATYTELGEFRVWSGVSNWEIYQYLAPGSQIIARLYEVKGNAQRAMRDADAYFYGKRLTPLVPVGSFPRLQLLLEQQKKALDDAGKWK